MAPLSIEQHLRMLTIFYYMASIEQDGEHVETFITKCCLGVFKKGAEFNLS